MHPLGVQIVLAGVDVGAHETAGGKGVEADVALGDHHEAAQAPRVLAVQRADLHHARLADGVHTQRPGKVLQQAAQHVGVRQALRGRAVAVKHQVDAKLFGADHEGLLGAGAVFARGALIGRRRSKHQ